MKTEVKEKIMKIIISDEKIKQIIESEEFYFQKAVDKYNEFMSLPKLNQETTKELLDRVIKLKNEDGFNYLKFLREYIERNDIYAVLLCAGQLITYIDSHGSNKKEFNKYDDKRTMADASVRQNEWIVNLLRYKVTENLNDLTEVVRNAIRYLMAPEKNISVLSDNHRKLICLFLFENSSEIIDFGEFIINEMSTVEISLKNDKNRNLVISKAFYIEEIYKLWFSNQTIWKVSHGNISSFQNGEREDYLKQHIVAVHKDTGNGQGQYFSQMMKIGDLFYLCYGGKSIKLLGVITSDATPLESKEAGWLKRSYAVLKYCKNDEKYTGVSRGWAPNYNSTCMSVKKAQFTLFEKEILTPFFDMKLDELFNNDIPIIVSDEIPIEPTTQENKNNIFEDLNYILYGPPGTGKTYNTVNYAVAIVENSDQEVVQAEEYKVVRERFEKYKKEEQIVFTTFHQSFGYEEFIEGIKPGLGVNGDISYAIENGIFKDLCEKAILSPKKNFILIIDEINRGNISKIFGELITLIEKTKRIGLQEEVMTRLPYSKKEFGVPKNVYLLGTMNTADRSIALLDTALRRRFEFIEMMPNVDVFSKLNDNNELMIEGINIKLMLDTMNKRIEILCDREHTIGHAYFIDLIKTPTIDNLSNIFVQRIIPLLQEYFYDDYERLRLVLADNQVSNEDIQFINVTEIPSNLFGRLQDIDCIDDKKVFVVNKTALSFPNAYIKIYKAVVEELQSGN